MHCGILGKPHFVPPASKSETSRRSIPTKFILFLAMNTTRGIVNTKCWLYQPGLISSVQSHADLGDILHSATNITTRKCCNDHAPTSSIIPQTLTCITVEPWEESVDQESRGRHDESGLDLVFLRLNIAHRGGGMEGFTLLSSHLTGSFREIQGRLVSLETQNMKALPETGCIIVQKSA
jgi:hypothetical protein